MSRSDTNEWLREVVELSMLYDFYGELLSDKAKTAFEGYVLDDMSLGELAEELGVSRQNIYDSVRRSAQKLRGYESKLRLVSKFEAMKTEVEHIRGLASQIKDGQAEKLDDIISIAEKMLDEA